jgi:hypothetical protein
MTTDTVAQHEAEDHLLEVVNTPGHVQRGAESTLFDQSVKRLKADGHYQCYVAETTGRPCRCGCTASNLQVHHRGREWSLENTVDYDLLGKVAMANDTYGYAHSAEFAGKPITSVDDIRLLMVLGQPHHTGEVTGIHATTEPAWLAQLSDKAGWDTVPQDESVIKQLESAKHSTLAQTPSQAV